MRSTHFVAPGQLVAPGQWLLSALTSVLLCCCLLLASAYALAVADGDREVKQGVTRDIIDAKIGEVEADQELDEDSRQLLMELYRKSISNLEGNSSNKAATEEFHDSIETAPVETAKLERQVRKFEQQGYDPDSGFNDKTPTSDIAQALLKQRANLSAVSADFNRLSLKLDDEQDRLTDARKQLAEANSRQSQFAASSDAGSGTASESADIKKARQWYRSTSLLALGSEIKRLDQELLSHGPRVDLLRMKIKRRQQSLEHLQAQVAAIETALGDRRQADATQAMAMAQAAQLAAEGKHPLLVKVAQDNATISEELVSLSNKIEGVSDAATEADVQAKELEDNYRSVRQKLDVAGMNKALGRILQDQRAELPKARKIESQLDKKEKLITDLALQQLIFDEKLKELSDIDSYVEALLDKLESEPDAESIDLDTATPELEGMLEQRKSLYKKIIAVNSAYLQSLSDLEYAQRRLLDIVEQYDTFLGERLLWVRSVPNAGIETLLSFSGDSARYFSWASWQTVWQIFVQPDIYWVVLLVGLLSAVVLRLKRPELLRRLRATNKHIGNPISDRFRYSLQSLGFTLLLSSPGPLLCGVIGVKLKFAVDHNALSLALAQALIWLAHNWFFIYAFREVCRPDGLAQRHLRWHKQVLTPLRKELSMLMDTFLPVSFVTVLLSSLDSSGMEWGIVRLALMFTMALYALFFMRLLRSKGGVMQALMALNTKTLLVRWRMLWMTLSVVIPLGLMGLAASGYVYTSLTLMGSFVETFWIVIIIILVHELAVRWLRMTSVKLNYQALQEERKKQLQELFASRQQGKEMVDLVEEPGVDLAHLGRDSLKLVNIVTGFLGIAGLLIVWSDVLPALGYLNNIELWSYSGAEQGEIVAKTVSLADLGLALLFIGIVYFIYRNLPSLLELLLLQFSVMRASDRYTVITLTRYVVLIVGVLLVAGLLGISWSQFQWMAAALGVGIGFGLQEIVANFISGLIILFERPIRVGDRVTVGDVDGIVTRIRARATTILTWDRQELLVPNKEFITGRLLNWSLSDQVSRLVIEVGVAYGSDVAQAMSLVAAAAENNEKVLADPAPFVTFEGFGDNTLNLKLRCYLDDMNIRLSTTSALHEAINTAFNEAGIVIAFPQRDIHFDPDQVFNVNLGSNKT